MQLSRLPWGSAGGNAFSRGRLPGGGAFAIALPGSGKGVPQPASIFGKRTVPHVSCGLFRICACGDDAWGGFGADRTYRFCPGYGGSGIGDNAEIFRELDPSRIGMQLLPSGMIAPQKSMAGIIGLGKSAHKSCTGCMIAGNCQYRKEGRTCYGSEKNC